MRYSTVGWDLGNPQLLISAYRSVLLVFPLNSSVAHPSLQSVCCEPQLVEFSLPVYQGVRNIAQSDVVTGMKLDSRQKVGPICEPSLAGKLNTAPFPSSSTRADSLLQLIHSDVHDPLLINWE